MVAVLNVAVIVTKPAAFSAMLAVPLKLTLGTVSLSVIVTVPLAVVLVVYPVVKVPLTVKVSLGSKIISCKIGIITFIEVLPAGIVTEVFVVVKSAVPAVPTTVAIAITVFSVLVVLKVTGTITDPSASFTVTFAILNEGAGLTVKVAFLDSLIQTLLECLIITV